MIHLDSIDGDIANFIDSQEIASTYSTDELLAYLRNEGHREPDILKAIHDWQARHLKPAAGGWVHFTLTDEGAAIVRDLRSRS